MSVRAGGGATGVKSAHFIAIGGQSMSGIASILLDRGWTISGSDLVESDLVRSLRQKGATVHAGHRAGNLGDVDLVVVSSAIHEDNPELTAARERGIPVVHRMDMLLRAVSDKSQIAIAGAHGKTTTTSMVAWTLKEAGTDPTFLVGGEFSSEGTSHSGNGKWAVYETDESDGSFLRAHADVHLATNIDNDHLDYWGTMEALRQAFFGFLDGIRPGGIRVVCFDDPTLREWAEGRPGVQGYGFSDGATWRGVRVERDGWGSRCEVHENGKVRGELRLGVPGRHVMQNALGALAAAVWAGVPVKEALDALATFPGAKRRLQRVGEYAGVTLIDDFAHHPKEIQATLSAVKAALPGRKLVVVFQPHRYSRTRILKDELGDALSSADAVVVTGIYAGPGETAEAGVGSSPVADSVMRHGNCHVSYVEAKEEAMRTAVGMLSPGDVLLTMGAGDVWKLRDLASELLTGRTL